MQLVCVTYPKWSREQSRYYLRLGTQTNADRVFLDALIRAAEWSPSKGESFDIYDFRHTDYDGNEVDHPTGYCSFNARYFMAKREGRFLVDDYANLSYSDGYIYNRDLEVDLNCRAYRQADLTMRDHWLLVESNKRNREGSLND